MQWIALEGTLPVFASQACKQKKYFCPECAACVKVRSGPHRQAHFYHVHCSTNCRQHQKTEEHLTLQLTLASQIPAGEGCVERAFPLIGRIADVAWEKRKTVYEIQCSPISLEEARQRCEDYRRAGWQLVWILSDKTFNRKRAGSAEAYLRKQTCYFSHWEKKEKNYIYDQWEIFSGFQRVYKGPPVPIQPLSIQEHSPLRAPPFSLPFCLQERWESWRLCVENDILTELQGAAEPSWIKRLKEIEKRLEADRQAKRLPWATLLKKSYAHFLKKMLNFLE